jgi:serine/threonine protein kinase
MPPKTPRRVTSTARKEQLAFPDGDIYQVFGFYPESVATIKFKDLQLVSNILGQGRHGIVQEVKFVGQELLAPVGTRFCLKYGAVPSHFVPDNYADIAKRICPMTQLNDASKSVVKVFKIWREQDFCYTLMEFAYPNVLSEYTNIDEFDAWGLILDMGTALQVIHMHGLTHNDIKPSNICYSKNEESSQFEFQLVDYDSMTISSQNNHAHIETTSQYMSPELMADDDRPPTGASDIYQLGLTVLDLLAIPKVARVTIFVINVESYFHDSPHTPSSELIDVLSRMLQNDPSQRITVAELIDIAQSKARVSL